MKHFVLSFFSVLYLSVCFLLLPAGATADVSGPMLPTDHQSVSGTIKWKHSDDNCDRDLRLPRVIQCGLQGSYYFDPPPSKSDGCFNDEAREYIPRRYEAWPSVSTRPLSGSIEKPENHVFTRGDLFAEGADNAIRIAVVDVFNRSVHGVAVSSVIHAVDPTATIRLFPLDDPTLEDVIGSEVNDLHVLAALCAIRDGVEHQRFEKPDLINLSIGRKMLPTDVEQLGSISGEKGVACTDKRISCAIGEVLDWLRSGTTDGLQGGAGAYGTKRTMTIAAAGNHGLASFPAGLSSTLSAGAIDISHLRAHDRAHGEALPLRETGPYDALMPSQNLCLYDTPMPFGTSFAAAFFTGALATNRQPVPVPTTGVWAVGQSSATDCIKLTFDGRIGGKCLAETSNLLAAVRDLDRPCWGPPENPLEVLGRRDTGGPDREIPTLQEFNARSGDRPSIAPQPETPYCVPCSGGLDQHPFTDLSATGLLTINTANTGEFPSDVHVHEIWYRYFQDGQFHYVLLIDDTGEEANDYEDALIDSIQLQNAWVPPGQQPSLEFVLRDTATGDCNPASECYRTSVPILMGASN